MRCILLVAALFLLVAGCSDVGYNPYSPNDGHRPVGKVVEDVTDFPYQAVNEADRRFEHIYD